MTDPDPAARPSAADVAAALTKRPQARKRRVSHALAAAGLLALVLGGVSLLTPTGPMLHRRRWAPSCPCR